MVGEDYVRNELAQRLRHVVASLDTPERAEDVGPADLALSERRVLGVVLDDQDPNGGRHCRFHVYEMAEASARVSASIVHFGLRRHPVKRAPRPASPSGNCELVAYTPLATPVAPRLANSGRRPWSTAMEWAAPCPVTIGTPTLPTRLSCGSRSKKSLSSPL